MAIDETSGGDKYKTKKSSRRRLIEIILLV